MKINGIDYQTIWFDREKSRKNYRSNKTTTPIYY